MSTQSGDVLPPLSYVLVATTEDEVRVVARWLYGAPLSPQVEVVLAAPARALGHVPARVIPPRVRLASAPGTPTLNALRMAGAAVTTGLVVIVIECQGDFTVRIRDPFAAQPVAAGGSPELARWATELDTVPG
jgi:hypothetical protein